MKQGRENRPGEAGGSGRAVDLGQVAVNPTLRLRLPRVTGRRDRIASPSEAAGLLAAVSDQDRALWAKDRHRPSVPVEYIGLPHDRQRPAGSELA